MEVAAEALAQQAAERLLDDEALRGELTDTGYGPLLDWAIDAATGLVAAAPNQQLFESRFAALRALVRRVAEAAGTGNADGLAAAAAPVFGRRVASRLGRALGNMRLGPDADANARAIVAALAPIAPGRPGGASGSAADRPQRLGGRP